MRHIIPILAILVLLAACAPSAPEAMPAVQPAEAIAPQLPEEPPITEPEVAMPEPAKPMAPAAGAKTVDVEIKGFRFTPSLIKIKAGDTVRWTNQDKAPHDATGTGWATRTPLQTGESDSVKFDTPGEYDYICSIHPSMKAKIIVE